MTGYFGLPYQVYLEITFAPKPPRVDSERYKALKQDARKTGNFKRIKPVMEQFAHLMDASPFVSNAVMEHLVWYLGEARRMHGLHSFNGSYNSDGSIDDGASNESANALPVIEPAPSTAGAVDDTSADNNSQAVSHDAALREFSVGFVSGPQLENSRVYTRIRGAGSPPSKKSKSKR
jgi:hypothetical protein